MNGNSRLYRLAVWALRLRVPSLAGRPANLRWVWTGMASIDDLPPTRPMMNDALTLTRAEHLAHFVPHARTVLARQNVEAVTDAWNARRPVPPRSLWSIEDAERAGRPLGGGDPDRWCGCCGRFVGGPVFCRDCTLILEALADEPVVQALASLMLPPGCTCARRDLLLAVEHLPAPEPAICRAREAVRRCPLHGAHVRPLWAMVPRA